MLCVCSVYVLCVCCVCSVCAVRVGVVDVRRCCADVAVCWCIGSTCLLCRTVGEYKCCK